MKKLIIAVATASVGLFASAASIGWTFAGMNSYANDAYQVFVLGQKGVSEIATVSALLDQGKSASTYAFGSGVVAANGIAAKMPTAEDAPTLAGGNYTSFLVLYDAATPEPGISKYALISGLEKQSIEVGDLAATATFSNGNIAEAVNSATWKSFGPTSDVPEPTSAMLVLLGMAGLALRRKQA